MEIESEWLYRIAKVSSCYTVHSGEKAVYSEIEAVMIVAFFLVVQALSPTFPAGRGLPHGTPLISGATKGGEGFKPPSKGQR